MIDEALVDEKLTLLRERLARLDRVRALSEKEYLEDPDSQRIAERCMETALAAVLDIGNHLIAAPGLERPREYRSIFRSLARGKVLDTTLAKRLESLAGLRNRLVHEYGDIDQTRLKAEIDARRSDFSEFAAAIVAFIDASGGASRAD